MCPARGGARLPEPAQQLPRSARPARRTVRHRPRTGPGLRAAAITGVLRDRLKVEVVRTQNLGGLLRHYDPARWRLTPPRGLNDAQQAFQLAIGTPCSRMATRSGPRSSGRLHRSGDAGAGAPGTGALLPRVRSSCPTASSCGRRASCATTSNCCESCYVSFRTVCHRLSTLQR